MIEKTIIITGSLGFIGSNLVRRLTRERSYKIICIDYCKNANLNNIYVNKNVRFHPIDITDRHALDIIFLIEKPDVVLHLAAESFVDQAIESAEPFIHSNVMGTQVLADLCCHHHVELVLISTDEVNGTLNSEAEPSWDESSPRKPRNPYSASKAAAEMVVEAAGFTHGLRYKITRSCNNYGPRQSMRNFIPLSIKHILNDTVMPIYGQGAEIREWIYVEDNCDAIIKIMEEGKAGEIYNIGTGHEMSNLEMFQLIYKVSGKKSDQLPIKFVANRKGHDFRYSLKNDKLKQLGWAPHFKLKEGLASCYGWYSINRWALEQPNKEQNDR